MCLFFFFNGVLQRGKKAKGPCTWGRIVLIYFQCLITNLLRLISLSCRSSVTSLFSFENLKGIEARPERHRGQSRCPRGLVTGLVLGPVLLFTSHIQITYFVQILLCLETDFETRGCFCHSNCSPCSVTATTWFN